MVILGRRFLAIQNLYRINTCFHGTKKTEMGKLVILKGITDIVQKVRLLAAGAVANPLADRGDMKIKCW